VKKNSLVIAFILVLATTAQMVAMKNNLKKTGKEGNVSEKVVSDKIGSSHATAENPESLLGFVRKDFLKRKKAEGQEGIEAQRKETVASMRSYLCFKRKMKETRRLEKRLCLAGGVFTCSNVFVGVACFVFFALLSRYYV